MPGWTLDKPTVSGFYWYNFPGTDDISIIEVIFDPDCVYDPAGFAFLFGIEENKGLYSLTGRFFGPIEVPKI